MQPLAIDLRLLAETGAPGIRLAPGRGLMARVMAADGNGRGVLNIAGAVIEAELPRHVRAGEELRLVVRHLEAGRVVLELAQAPPQTPPAVAPPVAPTVAPVDLPGGGSLRVVEDDESAGAGGESRSPDHHTLALRYDTTTLGTLELRFELDSSALRVRIEPADATAAALAAEQAEELRTALTERAGRAVTVTVVPRREPLDLYA